MVDRIVDFEGDTKCTGIKNVTVNEPCFPGHFPGHPIMPGVLQLEAMAQVSSVLMLRKPENAGKIGYFMSAKQREVPPPGAARRRAHHRDRADQDARLHRLRPAAAAWSPARSPPRPNSSSRCWIS
jgi:hypothetical protein